MSNIHIVGSTKIIRYKMALIKAIGAQDETPEYNAAMAELEILLLEEMTDEEISEVTKINDYLTKELDKLPKKEPQETDPVTGMTFRETARFNARVGYVLGVVFSGLIGTGAWMRVHDWKLLSWGPIAIALILLIFIWIDSPED